MYDSLHEFQQELFNRTKNQLHKPSQNLTEALASLRGKLIVEEAKELEEALLEGDMEHILKELADLFYVVYGTMVCYNIPQWVLDHCFDIVHKNNMDKISKGTINEHGKLVKPPNHPKADLSNCVLDWQDLRKEWLTSPGQYV